MRGYFFVFLFISLSSCRTYQLPVDSDTVNYRMDRSQEPTESNSIQDIIHPYKESLDQQMNEVIGSSQETMKKLQPESRLGNWVADAIQHQAKKLSAQKIDASIQNYGGIRTPELAAGDVTLGKMYEIMPFDNILVIVEMDGRVVQQLFNQLASAGGWPMSIEVSFTIIDNKAANLTIGRKTIDSDQIYHIGIPDYIANGNDGCGFLTDLNREDTGMLIRDLLIKEVKEQEAKGLPIKAEITGRVLR